VELWDFAHNLSQDQPRLLSLSAGQAIPVVTYGKASPDMSLKLISGAVCAQEIALMMQAYGEDDYLIFDCPGQIELYSHVTIFRSFVDYLKRDGWNLAAVYTIDCQFVADPTKFIAGSLQAMSAMVQLELPHVNILTKVDLLGEENKVHLMPLCTKAKLS